MIELIKYSWEFVMRRFMTRMGGMAGHPVAFALVAIYSLAWLIFSPKTFEWHGIATLSTWIMTVLIQRATHRDTQALHAKIDELLKADVNARSSLMHIDSKDSEEIEKHRDSEKAAQ